MSPLFNVSFSSLKKENFSMLLKWFESAHIKPWWDPQVTWDLEKIIAKYTPYTQNIKKLKLEDKIIEKPIYAFIIYIDNIPVGYVQYYNKHDFPPEQGYNIDNLPKNCAGLDFFIGEIDYIGKGLSVNILKKFLTEYVIPNFTSIIIDPDSTNTRAINFYKKVGFQTIDIVNNNKTILMSYNNGQ